MRVAIIITDTTEGDVNVKVETPADATDDDLRTSVAVGLLEAFLAYIVATSEDQAIEDIEEEPPALMYGRGGDA